MKTIVITGGSDGLGKELAKVLAKENKVIILARESEHLMLAAKEIGCEYVVCDIARIEDVKAAFENIFKKNKKVDCLINNAGVWLQGNVEDNTYEMIKNVIDVNIFGTIACTKAVLSHMKKNNAGQIININSMSCMDREEYAPVYGATKTASFAFRERIQNDLAKHNIRITDVCPGLMKTDLFKKQGNIIPKAIMDKTGLDVAVVSMEIKKIIDSDPIVWKPVVAIKHAKNIIN